MSGQLLYNLLIIFGLINLLHFGLYMASRYAWICQAWGLVFKL